jgi:chitodextrinase
VVGYKGVLGDHTNGIFVTDFFTSSPNYTFTGLTPNTDYRMAFRAIDYSGKDGGSITSPARPDAFHTINGAPIDFDKIIAKMGAEDHTPPTKPGNPALTAAGPYHLSVQWTPSTDDVGVREYTGFIYDLNHNVQAGFFNTPVCNYTFKNLRPNTEYKIGYHAVDYSGKFGEFAFSPDHPKAFFTINGPQQAGFDKIVAAMSEDHAAPTKPGAPVLTAAGPYHLSVKWAPSTDDVGVKEYTGFIYDLNHNVQVGFFNTPITSHTFTNLRPNTEYKIGYHAVDCSGKFGEFAFSPDKPDAFHTIAGPQADLSNIVAEFQEYELSGAYHCHHDA